MKRQRTYRRQAKRICSAKKLNGLNDYCFSASGLAFAPTTAVLANIGNVMPQFTRQNCAISLFDLTPGTSDLSVANPIPMHYPASVQQATPEIISTTVDPSRYLPQAHYHSGLSLRLPSDILSRTITDLTSKKTLSV
jgi:hypothetical protein